MASGEHINGFLWNRVSQGYARVVKDEPPQEAWRAWRRAASRDLKPVLYRTPVRDLPSVGSGHSAGPEPIQTTRSRLQPQSQSPPRGPLNAEEVVGPSVTVTSAKAAAGNASGSAAAGCCAPGINGNGEGDEDDDDDASMDHDEDVLTVALTPEHSNTQEWALPFPTSMQSSEAGPLLPREITLKFNAPENLKLALIRCTFSRVEDVGEDFSGARNFAYGCHADPSLLGTQLKVVQSSRPGT